MNKRRANNNDMEQCVVYIFGTFRQQNIRALLSYLKVSYLMRVCACLSLPFWFGVRSIRAQSHQPNVYIYVSICIYFIIHMYKRALALAPALFTVCNVDRLCSLPSSCLLPFAIFHYILDLFFRFYLLYTFS